jgi:hypothetical protein
VGLPYSYGQTERTYPVLYVLDADTGFATVTELSRMRGAMGEISEVIVIGLGYALDTPMPEHTRRRVYEFSTDRWDYQASPFGREFGAILTALGGRIGGLTRELDFITEELRPEVARRYRVDATDSAILGVSASGHFVAQALFRRPDAFHRYAALSPALDYNDSEVFRLEAEYARTHTDLPAQLYLSAGSGETRQLASAYLVSKTARLAEELTLRKYPGLKLTCDFFLGKTHLTAFTEGLNRALETFWPGVAFSMESQQAVIRDRGTETADER